MKLVKISKTMCVVLCFGLLLGGCTSGDSLAEKDIPISGVNKVKLDFLDVPEQIIVYDENKIKEVDKFLSETKPNIKIADKNDRYSENQRSMKILNLGKVIEDDILIKNIFNELMEIEGVLFELTEEVDVIAEFNLNYDKETNFYDIPDSIPDSYSNTINLLNDGHIIIPVVMTYPNQIDINYIKAKLPDELRCELEKLI